MNNTIQIMLHTFSSTNGSTAGVPKEVDRYCHAAAVASLVCCSHLPASASSDPAISPVEMDCLKATATPTLITGEVDTSSRECARLVACSCDEGTGEMTAGYHLRNHTTR